mmetsp:Transcript_13528/g.32049  ORF Transcript_13528/g.32049 Transcript_13528/m.32049 type:complete len:233 (-) Transcript_13528:998-1696(-)
MACCSASRTTTLATSPPAHTVTLVSSPPASVGRSSALPGTDRPPTVARKWRVPSSHAPSLTLVHSPPSSASRISHAGGPSSAAPRRRTCTRCGSPTAPPSGPSGCSSRGEAPAPPHTLPPSEAKADEATGDPGGSAVASARLLAPSQCRAERKSRLLCGAGGEAGSSSALWSSMKAVCTRPALKASLPHTRRKKGTLVGRPLLSHPARARCIARRASGLSAPRTMSLASIGS